MTSMTWAYFEFSVNVWRDPSENCSKEIEEFVKLIVAEDVVVDGDVALGSDAEKHFNI